jgi:hypothetical protein
MEVDSRRNVTRRVRTLGQTSRWSPGQSVRPDCNKSTWVVTRTTAATPTVRVYPVMWIEVVFHMLTGERWNRGA